MITRSFYLSLRSIGSHEFQTHANNGKIRLLLLLLVFFLIKRSYFFIDKNNTDLNAFTRMCDDLFDLHIMTKWDENKRKNTKIDCACTTFTHSIVSINHAHVRIFNWEKKIYELLFLLIAKRICISVCINDD